MPTSDVAVSTFTFRELTIWSTKLPHVEHAAMPHPDTAEIPCKLKAPGIEYPSMAHPDVKGEAIYTLTGGGNVYALRHPPII
jgi:hypothetical protein